MQQEQNQQEEMQDSQWREKLSPEQYFVCRQKGTERPFTGEYTDKDDPGLYLCACCESVLFESGTKYHSGSGWPSFWQAAAQEAIAEHRDSSHGMVRVEITCRECGSHLGHVFPDGPQPTGLRYCVNSLSLKFKPAEA
jgi:peptide-methionine (R)-S-oxide reductase